MPERRPRLGARQAALYAAESEALGGLGLTWGRVTQAQVYADRLVGSVWFTERWAHFGRCHVQRRGSGSVWSTCLALDGDGPGRALTEGVVLLSDGGLNQSTLLHELAHLLAGSGEGHSPTFARIHLELVRREMGFFAYADYRGALLGHAEFAELGSG